VEGHPSLKVEKQDAKCGEAHRRARARERESESKTIRKEEKWRNLGFRASEIENDSEDFNQWRESRNRDDLNR
jgi:hypothetical protein